MPSAVPAPDRATPESRDRYAAFETIPLRWNDNDIYGHLYNAAYYELFDSGMSQWLMRQGLLDRGGRPTNVVVENGCRYFRELRFPDEVEVALRLAWIRTSALRFDMALFRKDEDLAAAQGFFTVVRVDDETHRPRPIPEDQRAIYEMLALR